ncbi:hypothetical protein [Paenibacillus daejeonensis]|uniref:hypothetical protein n=1 Tax=Paenibacillus daejeonensis TaxID=135193 RepID=UPI000365D9A3|nr:hypothetical protein [Paenibacillus daejeonensis]
MWDIKEQILSASKKLSIELSILPKEEAEKIKHSIFNKYLEEGALPYFPLFESLNHYIGIDVPESWTWISNFVEKTPVILFFNPDDEKEYYKLKKGEDVVLILEEIFNVEFYITNLDTEYLLGYNHSQCLVACGTADPWLENHEGYKTRYPKGNN